MLQVVSSTVLTLSGFQLFGALSNAPQGIVCTDEDVYLSFTSRIIKTKPHRNQGEITKLPIVTANKEPMRGTPFDHMGAIALYKHEIIAPLEATGGLLGTREQHPGTFFEYSADTLKPGSSGSTSQEHFPWVAADEPNNLLYSSEFSGVNELFVYSADEFELLRILSLNTTLENIQGGAFYANQGGTLYLSTDTSERTIFVVDTESGDVLPWFDVGGDVYDEMEGIAFCADGTTMLALVGTLIPFMISFAITFAMLTIVLFFGVLGFVQREEISAYFFGSRQYSRAEEESLPPLGNSDSQMRKPWKRRLGIKVFASFNLAALFAGLMAWGLVGEFGQRGKLITYNITEVNVQF